MFQAPCPQSPPTVRPPAARCAASGGAGRRLGWGCSRPVWLQFLCAWWPLISAHPLASSPHPPAGPGGGPRPRIAATVPMLVCKGTLALCKCEEFQRLAGLVLLQVQIQFIRLLSWTSSLNKVSFQSTIIQLQVRRSLARKATCV